MKKIILCLSTILLAQTSFGAEVIASYPHKTSDDSVYEVRFQTGHVSSDTVSQDIKNKIKYGGLILDLPWDLDKDKCQLVTIRIDDKELTKKVLDPNYIVKSSEIRCTLRHIPPVVEPPQSINYEGSES